MINNIDYYIGNAKVKVKNKLINSIFPEKVMFDVNSYRTNSHNSVLDLIYQPTNELRGVNIKSEESFSTFFALVPRAEVKIVKSDTSAQASLESTSMLI